MGRGQGSDGAPRGLTLTGSVPATCSLVCEPLWAVSRLVRSRGRHSLIILPSPCVSSWSSRRPEPIPEGALLTSWMRGQREGWGVAGWCPGAGLCLWALCGGAHSGGVQMCAYGTSLGEASVGVGAGRDLCAQEG